MEKELINSFEHLFCSKEPYDIQKYYFIIQVLQGYAGLYSSITRVIPIVEEMYQNTVAELRLKSLCRDAKKDYVANNLLNAIRDELMEG